MMQYESAVENILLVKFRDKALLTCALSHRSFMDAAYGSNERLEFMGDSVVGLVITEYLYLHQKYSEGDMTKIKSVLVGRDIMSEIMQYYALHEYVYVGKSERKGSGIEKSILSNVLEAIIGAVYVDSGLEIARKVVLHLWEPFIKKYYSGEYRDIKSELQEML